MTKGIRGLLEVLFVSAICLISFLFVRGHEKDDAPTSDEGYHLFAGAEYVDDGTYWVNLEHPPLLKNFAGLALEPLHLPTPSMGKAPLDHTPHNNYIRFLYGAPVPADRIVSAARRPFPFLLVFLVVVVYVVTRQVFGIAAAPLAAGLIALEPSFVANASIVHTDVGAALTMTATIALGLWAARRRHVVCWLAVGLALGLALATKFSAVILVPAVLLFPVFSWLVEKPRPPWPVFRERLLGAAVAVGLAVLTLAAVYAIDMRRMPREYAREAVRLHLAGRGANAETIERYARFSDFSAPLGHYLAGLKGVALFSQNGRGANYFHGRVSQSGFLLYFPVAFLIKTTPSLLALVFLIPILGRRETFAYWPLGLLLCALGILALSMSSSFNIGVRHILPLYPLVAIAGAGLVARRLTPRVMAAFSGVLLVSSGISLARIHPFELAYFNFLVGGPRHGVEWLSDSNLDWGQDLKRVSLFLKEKGWDADTTLVSYSGIATNYYLPKVKLLEKDDPIRPGRYAVSALMETLGEPFVATIEGPEGGRKVGELVRVLHERGRKVATVGYTFTIWELR